MGISVWLCCPKYALDLIQVNFVFVQNVQHIELSLSTDFFPFFAAILNHFIYFAFPQALWALTLWLWESVALKVGMEFSLCNGFNKDHMSSRCFPVQTSPVLCCLADLVSFFSRLLSCKHPRQSSHSSGLHCWRPILSNSWLYVIVKL